MIGALVAAIALGSVQVNLEATTEDGKPVLLTTVTREGKPVEGAAVVFEVQRTFGRLSLGKDVTLDDGTAVAPLPDDLYGNAGGSLTVSATVTAPAELAGARASLSVSAPAGPAPESADFPRALWAPRAPMPLILAFAILLGGVWATYAFIVLQLVRIWKGASSK